MIAKVNELWWLLGAPVVGFVGVGADRPPDPLAHRPPTRGFGGRYDAFRQSRPRAVGGFGFRGFGIPALSTSIIFAIRYNVVT